jgi:hypothetical protein
MSNSQTVMQEKMLKQDEFKDTVKDVPANRDVPKESLHVEGHQGISRLSNYHGFDTVVVQRKQRDETYNGKSCPKAMADYSKFMGGVDTANQLRSYYERDRPGKKWWNRLLYALLETSLVNAWICFNDLAK